MVRVEVSELHGLPLSQILLSNVILWRVRHDLHSHVVFAELVQRVKCLLDAVKLSHMLPSVVKVRVVTCSHPESAIVVFSHLVDEVSLKLHPCVFVWVQEWWVYDVYFGTRMSLFRGVVIRVHVDDTRMPCFQ